MIKLSLAKLAHRTVEHSTVLDGKRYAFEVLFEIKYTAILASITGSNSLLDSCFYCRHALLPPGGALCDDKNPASRSYSNA